MPLRTRIVKVLDVIALVVLATNCLGTLLSATGLRVTSWSASRRWATTTTATFGIAAVVAGVVPLRAGALITLLVEAVGWSWQFVGRRHLARATDPTVARAVGTLAGLGLVVQVRLSGSTSSWRLVIAGVALFLGVILVVSWRHVDRVLDHGVPILATGLLLYCVAAVFSGGAVAGVPGPAGEIQVGDLARLLVLVGTAMAVANEPLRMSSVHDSASGVFRGAPSLLVLGPVAIAWAAALVFAVLTRDFGGAALLFIELVVVLASATGRLWPLVFAVPILGLTAVLANASTGYLQERVDIWLDPDRLPVGHQHVLAMSAWTDGGWWGHGLGGGTPTAVPAIRSDYVLAAYGEELGVVGTTAVLVLVASIVVVATRVACQAGTRQSLLAMAIGVFIGLQALAVVLGSTGALPLTGIPFPWLSHGGTAFAVNTIAAGMLTAITPALRRPRCARTAAAGAMTAARAPFADIACRPFSIRIRI